MPDHLGEDMRKVKVDDKNKEEPEIKGNLYKNIFLSSHSSLLV